VQKKGLPATPSSPLPWSAKRFLELTVVRFAYDCIIYFFLPSLQGFFLRFLLAIMQRLGHQSLSSMRQSAFLMFSCG
jgi:hypothetical protein